MKWNYVMVFMIKFVWISNNIFGQSENYMPDVIPPAPNAASLGKYGDIPVNHFTGVPQISIPLYDFKNKTISFPISLNYHASGVKVDEIASWVGLGWSLDAGGVISRSVIGKPDDSYSGFMNLPFDPTELAETEDPSVIDCQNTLNIVAGGFDTQSDIFNYNFAGYSGKFVFDTEGNIHLIPQQPLKIIPMGADYNTENYKLGIWSFKVITPDGTEYWFEDIENTVSSSNTASAEFTTFFSAWNLTKIIAPNNSDQVLFTYEVEMMITQGASASISSPLPFPEPKCPTSPSYSYKVITNEITTKRLSGISASGFVVSFIGELREDVQFEDPGSKRLKEIIITGNEGLVKEFKFNYSYFISPTLGTTNWRHKRLKLESIQEKGADGSVLPPHEFLYSEDHDLPPVYSAAKDHWGFSNGQVGNDESYGFGSEIPEITHNGVTYPGADREPNAEFGETGTLIDIKYPTGGHTYLEYEGHDYKQLEEQFIDHTVSAVFTNDGYANVHSTEDFVVSGTSNQTVSFQVRYGPNIFAITEPFTAWLNGKVEIRNLATNDYEYVTGFDTYNVVDDEIVWEYPFATITGTIELEPGTYIIKITPLSEDAIQINAKLDWQESTGMHWVNKPAGGIRIKQITDDPDNGGASIARTYQYNTVELVEVDPDISSGVLYQSYRYYTVLNYLSGPYAPPLDIPDICQAIQRFTNSVLPLSMTKGNHIGYGQVLEQWEGNGSIRYFYKTDPKDGSALGYPALVTSPTTSRDYKRGMLIQQITYNQAQKEVAQKRFIYDEDLDAVFEFDNIVAYPDPEYVWHPPYSGAGSDCHYSYDTYKHISSWIYLKTEIVTAYDQNGENPIESTTTYKYDNPIHRQPTEIEVFNNAGSYTTRTKYPADYGCDVNDWFSGTCTDNLSSTDAYADAILKMKNQLFMHAYPIEVQKFKNGRLIEGTINLYKDFGSGIGIQVEQVLALETPTPMNTYLYGSSTLNLSYPPSFNIINPKYKHQISFDYTNGGFISEYIRPNSGNRVELVWNESKGLLTSKSVIPNSSDFPTLTDKYQYHPLFRTLTSQLDLNEIGYSYDYDSFGRLKLKKFCGELEESYLYHYAGQSGNLWYAGQNILVSDIPPFYSDPPHYSDINYVATTQHGIVNGNAVNLAAISYIDGLGRPIQQVKQHWSPKKNSTLEEYLDLVTPIEYDAFGRQLRQYQQYPDDGTDGMFQIDALSNLFDYYNTDVTASAMTDFPYSETRFEASPLNRPFETSAPGDDWAMGNGHTVTTQYLHHLGYYNTQITDEDGKTATQLKDAMGRIVIQINAKGTSLQTETHYLYDGMDNLVYVVSPAGIYEYQYDERRRMTQKIIPDKDVEYFVYDALDRLILRQDGNLRENSLWQYSIYDDLDRIQETGLVETDLDRETLQATLAGMDYSQFSNFLNQTSLNFETPEPLTITKWDNPLRNAIARTAARILDPEDYLLSNDWIITIFDEYDNKYRPIKYRSSNHLDGFDGIVQGYNSFDLPETYQHEHTSATYGGYNYPAGKEWHYLPTLHLSSFLCTGANASMTYNAIGQLTEKNLHQLGVDEYLQSVDYSYNPRNWLTAINDPNNLSAGGEEYDDLFAMSLYYNEPSSLGGSANYNGNISAIEWKTEQDGLLRAYGFGYDALNRLNAAYDPIGFSEACNYNLAGNITELVREGIKSHDPNPVWGEVDKLAYSYSPFSNQPRFIDDEVQDTDPDLNDFKDNGSINTPASNPEYGYDANGNMVMDANKGIMIQYNHLNLPRTVTFADGKTITWIYDATGRKLQKRTCELRSGTTPIVISDIKRPDFIDEHRHQSERIKHISTNRTPAETSLDIIDYYVATNIKIQTAIQQTYIQTSTPIIRTNPPVVEPDRESCNIRDYVLGLEYLNEEMEGYYHEEGRINLLEGGRVEYTLKDHLGNGRVYCYHDAALNQVKTIQEAHYYPFGLPIQKLSPNFEESVGVEANLYQYNGIELVEDFGLHVNHAQFRTLDPQTGRWWQIDPMAEDFYAWSPYNSNLDNPILYDDPKGDCPPWICGAAAGAGIEYLFQVGQNYSEGKIGGEMFKVRSWGKIGIAATAGAVTGGLSTLNQISGRGVAFAANRLTDGGVSAVESYTKQTVEIRNGEREAVSTSEIATDVGISIATGGWGEGAESAAKGYLKNEFNGVTQAVIVTASEFQENGYQKIATATMSENSTPRNQYMASPKPSSTQPTQKPSTMPASGNRMATPQPILQPDNF